MLINKSVESGVTALLMLACQEGHTPVTGEELAIIMGVSDSYLKKTMRKLVVAGLVSSIRNKDGGFVLSRPITQISAGDACRALMGEKVVFAGSRLAANAFIDCDRLPEGERTVGEVLQEAVDAYFEKLDTHYLSELLRKDVWIHGTRNWPEIARRKRLAH